MNEKTKHKRNKKRKLKYPKYVSIFAKPADKFESNKMACLKTTHLTCVKLRGSEMVNATHYEKERADISFNCHPKLFLTFKLRDVNLF